MKRSYESFSGPGFKHYVALHALQNESKLGQGGCVKMDMGQ